MSGKTKIIITVLVLLAGGAVAWQIKRGNDDTERAAKEAEEAEKASDLASSMAGLAGYCVVVSEQGLNASLQRRSKAANRSYVRSLTRAYKLYPEYEYEPGQTFREAIESQVTDLDDCDPDLAENLYDSLHDIQ